MGNWIRNVVLIAVIAVTFSGLVMADYFLRHEPTGKTRRFLKQRNIELDSASVLKAVKSGDLDLLDSLQQAGVDLGEPGALGETALIAAVKSGEVEIQDYLLANQRVVRSLEHQDGNGQTALLVAVKQSDYTAAAKLLGHGAKLGGQWEDGLPLIMAAVKKDDVKLFDFLIKQGVSVKEKDAQGLTALQLAVKEGEGDWVVRLLKAGAEVNQMGDSGEALLQEVIQGGQTGMARTLVEYGADVDIKNKAGETALMVALKNTDREAASLLLDAGAKMDGIDAHGRSIADQLIEAGEVGMVEFFAAKTGGGITDEWMVKVFEVGKTDLLQELLKKGGNVEAESEEGGRLLKRAVLNKDLPMVELLLAAGADPNGEVWDALATGDRAILEKLLLKGADANESLAVGVGSPLSLALRQRRYDSAELLLQHGADPDPRQANGRSLLEEAKSRLDDRAVSILRDYCAGYHEEVYPGSEVENRDEQE